MSEVEMRMMVEKEVERLLLGYHLIQTLIQIHGTDKAQEELRKIVQSIYAGMM